MTEASPYFTMTVRYKDLWLDLVLAGVRLECEVCSAKDDLSLHHVVPIAHGGDSTVGNLSVLCKGDHALLERFYWNERQVLAPEVTLEIKRIARRFKAGSVPQKDLHRLKDRTKELWLALNTHPTLSTIDWWTHTFDRGKQWASTLECVRVVQPQDAITEDPWFIVKEIDTVELRCSS